MSERSTLGEEVVAAYATSLFVRSDTEVKRPVVLLTGERTNVFNVLERHFKDSALPPSEKFWRTVRQQWTPQLDTWRPRVNGVQLKVLAGARLPESEEEWGALATALVSVRKHLRSDTSVDRLHADLRSFVGMVVDWWGNRRKTEQGPTGMNGINGLMMRVASAGLLLPPGTGLGGMPPAQKQCLEYAQMAPPPNATMYQSTIYSAPEIMPHALLGAGGSGRLPDRLPMQLPAAGNELAVASAPPQAAQQQQQQQQEGSGHGGGSYMQHLTGASDSQMFGPLFPGDAGGGEGDANTSPQDAAAAQLQTSALPSALLAAPGNGVNGGAGGYHPQSPRGDLREGSADNKASRPAAANQQQPPAPDGKVFVTLNVGGHRFLTTAATLAAVGGSYFSKLAHQAAAAAAKGQNGSEYFVDRSGKIFEYVLDFLRSHRFADSPSILPRDERTLQLLAREADFYQLPDLADRARSMLALMAAGAAAVAGGHPGEETPSDVPANIAEGSAHGGQLLAARFGSAAALTAAQQQQQQQQPAAVLDAVFLETGFQEAAGLATAQASLLLKLNAMLQARQADGFALVSTKCGTEREGANRNLFYHVLFRKSSN